MKIDKGLPVFLLLILFAFSANGQKELQLLNLNRSVVSMSPFNMFGGQLQLGIEKDFKQGYNSFLFLGSFILNDNEFGLDPVIGSQAELHYRVKFIVQNNPQKRKNGRLFRFDFYAGPYSQYQFLQTKSSYTFWDEFGIQHFVEERLRLNSVGGGVIMGARFIFLDRISIDVYAGGGVKYTFNSDAINPDQFFNSTGMLRPGRTAIIPKGNFQIGVAF